MKVFHEVHDFVAGGSWVALAGVATALVVGALTGAMPAPARAALVFGTILVTFVASTFERPG